MHKNSNAFPAIRKTQALSLRSEENDSPMLSTILRGSVFGLIFFAIAALLLLTAVTAVAYANTDPDKLIAPLSLVALLPAMFTGGFITAKKVGAYPLLCGIVCGALITLFTIALSLAMSGAASSGYTLGQSALLHGLAVAFSILGAFAGNYKRKPNPRKRRFGN